MKTLPISRWLLLSWFGTVFVAFILFNLVFRLEGFFDSPGAQSNLNSTQELLTSNFANWKDPTWQHNFRNQAASSGVSVEIKDAANQPVFQTGSTIATGQANLKIIIINSSGLVATIYPSSPNDYSQIRLTVMVLGSFILLSALLVIGKFLQYGLLRPLTAISLASRQVATGNLNFNLSKSRVREVAEVSSAFEAMGSALQVALKRQTELENERRMFISSIAHDLRTPLFSLRGYLEGLEKGVASTPEKAGHYLLMCQESALLLEQRISDLFSYVRAEYLGQMREQKVLNLRSVIQKVSEIFRPKIEVKEISLQLNGLEEDCLLKGDEQLLTRVLENLLDNALHYTPQGGKIEVNWGKDAEGWLVFSVADNGPGITLKDLPHIFTPLYRGDPSRNQQTGGTGLGLTIAQRILQEHNGSLKAANLARGGAIFTVRLPTG